MRKYGAPMSMVTYDDLQKPAVSDKTKKVYELVSVRIHAANNPMPPMNYPRLATTELATMDGWIAAGALAGADPTCGGQATVGTTAGTGGAGDVMAGTGGAGAPTGGNDTMQWPADCQDHYKLVAYAGSTPGGGKYTVAAGSEEHPSFFYTPPWAGAVQAVAFKPITDNAAVLHHWILYDSQGQFVTGWAPGSEKDRPPLPADVGMYLPAANSGQQLRLDVHYNNLGGTSAEMDASGVEACVISDMSKFRANTATIYGFTGNANAPAHQMVDNVSNCSITAQSPVHLLTNSPHMHKLGVHAKLVWTPQGGQPNVLHDAPFSFDDQQSYALTNIILNSGDQMQVTCSYNNTSDVNVSFGQNTEDEMCFNFALYYPMGALSCF
jgi:hypothetical protein